MDSEDARGSLERGAGDPRCTCSGGGETRRVTAALILQSLLTVTCAAFSLYIFFGQTSGPQEQHDTGIYLDINKEEELTALWNKKVDLQDKKKLVLSCAGPYMVYLWACVRSVGSGMSANLTMLQGDKIVYHYPLRFDVRKEVCQDAQRVVMLSTKSKVTFKLEQFESDIKILNVGLHYMLGDQCFPFPLFEEE